MTADLQNLLTNLSSAEKAVDYDNTLLGSLLEFHVSVKTRMLTCLPVLLSVTNDRSECWFSLFLMVLDLSSAFDTVDLTILLHQLHHTIGP